MAPSDTDLSFPHEWGASEPQLEEKAPDLDELLVKWAELVAVQTAPGNADFSQYMRGMANGMILADHFFGGLKGAPAYLDDDTPFRTSAPAPMGLFPEPVTPGESLPADFQLETPGSRESLVESVAAQMEPEPESPAEPPC